MKKVLYAASTFGHIAAFHRSYLRFLKERGYEVTVLAGGTPCPLPEADRLWQVPFEKKITSPKNFQIAGEIAAHLKREHYDIISVHTALASFFVRLAVKLAGKGNTTVLNTVHGYLFDDATPRPKRLLLLTAEKLTAGVTDCVLTMNRADTAIAQRERLGKEIIHIPGMGIDYDRFSVSARHSESGQFTLVYAAELSNRKNQQMLLRALARLPEAICLKLMGTGRTLEECQALAQSLGIAERVTFMGYVSDVPAVYAAADVCVS
ncbi:MAG: glycosyltransferase, partial [Angelakisella sp.]